MRRMFLFVMVLAAVFVASGCNGDNAPMVSVTTYSQIVVDYNHSLSDMIAAGKYAWVSPGITEKYFPLTGNGKVELNLELIHFNRRISSDEAIAELKKRGLRPATLPELLSFCEKYPEEQRKSPVALGQTTRYWRGRLVPFVWYGVGGRGLNLGWFEGGWDEFSSFLGVREP